VGGGGGIEEVVEIVEAVVFGSTKCGYVHWRDFTGSDGGNSSGDDDCGSNSNTLLTHCNKLRHTATHSNTLQHKSCVAGSACNSCIVGNNSSCTANTGSNSSHVKNTGSNSSCTAKTGKTLRVSRERLCGSLLETRSRGAGRHCCVAVCCSVLQCVAVCCSVLQGVKICAVARD